MRLSPVNQMDKVVLQVGQVGKGWRTEGGLQQEQEQEQVQGLWRVLLEGGAPGGVCGRELCGRGAQGGL